MHQASSAHTDDPGATGKGTGSRRKSRQEMNAEISYVRRSVDHASRKVLQRSNDAFNRSREPHRLGVETAR
eukprot:2371785-Karenia_brevis.AAC.1